MNSLLPPNATAAERALEATISRLTNVAVPVRDIWSPDDCPAALLPWLAWTFSVDGWENTWSDQQKRDSIKAAYYVHSRKGTAAAMRAALAALGLGLVVVEWFDETPQGAPYTFRVKLDINQVPASQADLQRVAAVINDAKNLRSHLAGLDLTIATGGAAYFAGATSSGHEITITPGT